MKKAVRKGASKAAALVLSLAMIFGMVPMVGASAEETAGAQDNFDRIVHLDMGRKYFTPEWIEALIKESAALGYTALELDFSNNEGFRFSLPEEQMQIEVGGYETVLVEVEPEEPAAPVEPTEPAAPVESAEPVEPTEPAAPVESTEPVEPTEPAAPVEPTEPTESAPQYKEVQVWNSKTVDLTAALSSDGYITADQMEDIIACADEAGVEIIPLLNSPGHMGAILDVFPEYRWTAKNGKTSESTIDLRNEEAVAFAQGVVRAYAAWFAEQGCKTFNIGADEFANDIGDSVGDIMGLDYIYKNDSDLYGALIAYIDDLAVIVKGCGMTPRAFNDSFCYSNDTSYAPSRNIQVCYWSPGWYGYSPASASTLADEGYELINTHGNYYYILGKDDCWDDGDARYDFDNNAFAGGSNISDPAGAMFCIWCDDPNAETEQQVAEKIRLPLRVMAARMQDEDVSAGSVDMTVIPGGFNADGTINTDAPSTEVKDEDTGVAVTAPGLTGIAVEKAEVSALAEVPYVAYNVTLNGGGYTGSAEVTIPLAGTGLENADALMGFVLEDSGAVTSVDGTLSGTDFTFTSPHFSTVGVYDASALAASSVAGDYEQFTGTMEEGRYLIVRQYTESSWSGSTTHYYAMTANGGSWEVYPNEDGMIPLNEQNEGLLWTFTGDNSSGFAITNGSSTLGITGSYSFPRWSLSLNAAGDGVNRFYVTFDNDNNAWNIHGTEKISDEVFWGTEYTDVYLITTNNEFGAGNHYEDSQVYLYKLAEPTYPVTIICETEDGIPIGEPSTEYYPAGSATIGAPSISGYDVVGDSEQTITVTPSGPNTVTFTYKQSENPPSNALRGNSLEVEWWITNSMVRKEDNDQADSSTTISSSAAGGNDGVALTEVSPETAYSNYDGWVELHYWQSMRLDRDNHQTGDGGDDETADGTVITRVRYHNGAWQYMDENGLWNWFVSGDQVVTYYMRHTDITKEITTAMKDWGYDPNTSGGTSDTSGGDGQVALSVAVVYPDGSLSPAERDIYLNSTTIFNYWEGRDIGIIAPINNSEYTVTRITVVDGKRDDRGWGYKNDNVWYDDDTIIWDKENGRFVEREVWSEDMGGAPMVNGKVSDITWPAKSTAKLVLIYLEPVKRESNLKVEYRVDDASKTLLYNFDVVVSETAEDPVTFLNSLVNGSVQPPHPSGEIDLSDDAYIVNSSNVRQTFNKNLATIPNLDLSARYNYVRAEISEDGKTLILYYNRLASQYQFVVDYGLPVEIDFAALSIETDGLQSVSGGTADMSVAANLASQTLTVTPNRILNDIATVPLTLTYEDTSGGTNTQEVTVDFIPASTVYYEDSFVEYDGAWKTDGTAVTGRTQTTSALDDKAIYGYDAAYGTDTTYSGGSAQKVTLSSGETATATFSFRGTGFQLVSMTDSTSGCIIVHVEGNGVDKYYFVDNYYASGTLYQVPVMKVDDLELGSYTVTVTACYLNSRNWDSDEAGTSTFVLDGIRIYKPIGDYADYAQDNEDGAVYSEIRNILVGFGWNPSNSVYVDTLGESTNEFDKYLKVGPNNEVYLKENDQITFTVPADEGGSIVQIGAKLVSGGSMTFSVTGTGINDSETINTATEMYYLLENVKPGDTITIAATGGDENGILSLTNLKLVSGS